ncbi:MAG: UDP-N-acetylmuramoyl-L-alanine--D-glutamate ligase [Caldilinea sp.]|uniref:UDP-N-acetylmuramoyl-L-alanine--D-glutamate ligase n=1 Tax=Caldilinea sp. TaxID=2293560 RepID=UPI0030A2B1C0
MFRGRQIVILGLARQGTALARFFVAAGAHVTISDAAPAERLATELARVRDLPVELALGGHPLHLLDGCDLLCLSGGVPAQLPIVQEAIRRKIPLSNDSLLTLQLARQRGLGPIAAITGSSGKTTTTTLVGEILAASGRRVHVGGNIGTPLIDRLETIAPGDCIVLELSSFQLELFDRRWAWGPTGDPVQGVGPDVAAILNITPNHLDRHPDMAAYAGAKFNLLRCLPEDAAIVLSAEDAITRRVASSAWRASDPPLPASWAAVAGNLDAVLEEVGALVADRRRPPLLFHRYSRVDSGAWGECGRLFYQGQEICLRREVRLRGEHNVGNLLAAAAISGALGADVEAMGRVARTFRGVPHRLEVVAEVNGVTWVNDSIATSPERAVAGLRSFDAIDQALILLAGGKDKKLPWEEFADEVLARVDMLIGFGEAGEMIVRKVQERATFRQQRAPSTAVVHRLDEAVELAAQVAEPGAVVLLSPGGTSYDAYRDFEARGEHFRQLVKEIAAVRATAQR